MLDGRGVIVAYNEASAQFVGVPPEMLLGKNIRQIDQEPYISGSVTCEALEKKRLITKYKKMPFSGKLLLITAKPIFDKGGNLEFIIVNDRDMTSTVETQTELTKSRENLEKLKDKIQILTKYDESQNELICQSPQFMDTVQTALMLASLDESNILLLGETGTGKGRLARLIHRNSQRASNDFVHINCAALPEALLEAELFGYEKGAFTGASQKGKIGLMELADKGTLFLDEIGVALTMNGLIDDTIAGYIDKEFDNVVVGEERLIEKQSYDLNKMSGLFEKMMILKAMKNSRNTR